MKQVLVALICLSIVTSVILAGPTPIRKNCCRKYSKSIPAIKNVQEYRIQENNGRCRIKAVVFTVKRRQVCSNPDDSLVKELLKKLSQNEQN
ncbi:C-C motif chemokine 16-like [Rhincodon typus]|uniref:C-C motif chemokine 16-like n=1 Tax=Rhincodon typus TaxID=259920 RepID=UPI00202F7F10|nr:C-C motif chemokine 16-like [Rhincodon typus]